MKRRTVLSGLTAGSLGAFAGCMSGECTSSTTVIFEPVDAETVAADQKTNLDRAPAMVAELADRIIAGEEPTVEILRHGPFSEVTYGERDGGFYEIAEAGVTERSVPGPTYELSYDPAVEAKARSTDAVSFADLPRHDQWRVTETARYAISEDGIDASVSRAFVAGYIDEADQEASMLAAGIDSSAIEAGGDVAKIVRLGEGSADARRYQYTATRVADDVDGFVDHVLGRRSSTAFDPNAEVRRLLSEIQDAGGSMRICNHDPSIMDGGTAKRRQAAVDELVRELYSLSPDGDDPPTTRPVMMIRYVLYEGQWYRVGIPH